MSRARALVGRDRDVARLEALLAEHAIVTVWGPGGIGKTRLALELLERRRGTLVELAEAHTLEDLTAAIAHALGSKEETIERIAATIRDAGLLVFDNFEQLADHAAAIAPLAAKGRAHIVITSRERLRLRDETCLELEPLDVAAGAELFALRAKMVRPELEISGADAERVREIARRLDCIPLAIELAAARADMLGLAELEQRLTASFAILGRGPRDGPARHATMEDAIRWSWDHLDAGERSVLAQSAVFRGGFSLEAAEAIIEAPGAIVDVLQSLRDKSLLRARPHAATGAVRFEMLDTIRAFAERELGLDSAAAKSARARHAAFWISKARAWTKALDVELANATAALEHALDDASFAPDQLLDALLALEPQLSRRGPYTRWLPLLDRALARAGTPPSLLSARIMRSRARVQQRLGHLDRAASELGAALEIARKHRSHLDEGAVLADLGVLRHQERRIGEAESFYRAALEVHRRGGHRAAEGRVLGNLGALDHDRRAFDAAETSYLAALAIYREVGDVRLEGLYLANLGILDHERGRVREAAGRYERALELLRDSGDDRLLAITLGNRGVLHQEVGRFDEALECHRRALELLEGGGDQRSRGLGLIRRSMVLAMRGESASALASRESAASMLSTPPDLLGLELVRLAGAFNDLAAARFAWLDAGEDAAREHSTSARERIAETRRPTGANTPLLERSDDARIWVNMLERELAAIAPDAIDPLALSIAPGARAFRPPSGEWQDLRKRAPLKKLLAALVRSRLAEPGRPTGLEVLREVAWPGEKILDDAAANRVYVALTTLRKAGLAGILISSDAGYHLDERVVISLAVDTEDHR